MKLDRKTFRNFLEAVKTGYYDDRRPKIIRLDTQDDLLFRGSEPVPLGKQAISLLWALITVTV
jgi:hypothetical protein